MHGWTDPLDQSGAPLRPAPPTGRPPQAPHPDAERPTPSHAVPGPTPARGRGGRHRGRWALPGPLALAAAVAVLLVTLGVGTALLPPSFVGGQRPMSPGGTAAGAGGSRISGAEPAPSGSPTPSAATGRPRPAASPTRTIPLPPGRTPSKTPTTAGSGREQQVLAIVNQERTANGCGAVKMNSRLGTAARLHSRDQAAHNNMSHTGSDGSSPWQRAERAGYDHAIGENVAAGYRTAAAVMDGWMNSSGHRANILNCKAKAIGIGVAAASDGTVYWTQLFGSVA